MTRWQKERLADQLKFFGAKKTKFISMYARKPRVLMSNTKKATYAPLSLGRQQAMAAQALADARSMALYQQQTQLDIQNSSNAFYQMQQLNGLMGMSNGADIAQARNNPFIPYLGGFS